MKQRFRRGFTLIELVVVIAIVSILAALAIANLLRSRTSANEATAATQLKAYSVAQVTFQTGKQGRSLINSKTGEKGYCDNFRNLFYGNPVEDPNVTLSLISRALANAFGRAPATTAATTHNVPIVPDPSPMAVTGYLFAEAKELNATADAFVTDFAMIGVPIKGKVTGFNAYWIGQQGTVWMTASGVSPDYAVSIDMDTPSNPLLASAEWIGL